MVAVLEGLAIAENVRYLVLRLEICAVPLRELNPPGKIEKIREEFWEVLLTKVNTTPVLCRCVRLRDPKKLD